MPKNHTYVNFTDRVAAIRIDPIRRSNQKRNVPDAANTDSLFYSSLERWSELNLASHFTKFASQCSPMTQSLPMLLHNQNKVFDLLDSFLNSTDIHSSESLLDLLVNFARDLGEDFEPYFARSLETCVSLIRKYHRDDQYLEIVEQTFNCLAHLFKYLSRLLTTDLVPTYKQVLPLFGGQSDFKPRSYVLRFAAESISFLVRRCSGSSLESIVNFIVSNVADHPQNEQLMKSSTLLLATTLKGPSTTLHSKTPVLLHIFVSSCHKYSCVDLIAHVLVDILHHTRKEEAKPVYETMYKEILQLNDTFCCFCLFVLAGHRKGDRVSDWSEMYEVLINLGEKCNSSLSWTEAASAIISFADFKTSANHLKSVLQICDDRAFFRIIEIVHQTNPNIIKTFKTLFWTELQHKSDKFHPQLISLLFIDIKTGESGGNFLNNKCESLIPENNLDIRQDLKQNPSHTLFDLWWKAPIVSKSNANTIVQKLLELKINNEPALDAFRSNVIAEYLVPELTSESVLIDVCRSKLTPNLLDSIGKCIEGNMFAAKEQTASDLLEALSPQLHFCLSSPDIQFRRSALKVLMQLLKEDPHFLLDQCSLISSLPIDLDNARGINHRLRVLSSKYKLTGSKSTFEKTLNVAIINFFFGMLTVRLQPICKAVMECMINLSEKSPDLVCSVALRFIEQPEPQIYENCFIGHDGDFISNDITSFETNPELDCHTLSSLQQLSLLSWNKSHRTKESLIKKAFESVKFIHYDDLRSLGIKALCVIPKIAEKQLASTLTHYLLNTDDNEVDSNTTNSDTSSPFTFNESVAILELFSKFSNPEKLLNFSEVKLRYLYFLKSRHTPLQKLALKCLLTIHQHDCNILRKYQENMHALLDDKRFRDELTGFVCAGKDDESEGSLHPDDKKSVMPFIIRILYGRVQNGTKQNMRQAVLSSLHFFESQYLLDFINLAHMHLSENQIIGKNSVDLSDPTISRRVRGYLTLMNDFVHQLKSRSETCIPAIVKNGIGNILLIPGLHDSKVLRQLISKILDEMISSVPKLSVWDPLFPGIYHRFIEPQLDNFGAKNLENSSALMKLVLTISAEKEVISLLDDRLVNAIVSCVQFRNIKDSVLVVVLKIIINLATNGSQLPVTKCAITAVIKTLPMHMDAELSTECFATIMEAIIKIFEVNLISFDAELLHNLAITSLKALQKPSRLVPLPVKGRVLKALSQILDSESCTEDLMRTSYDSLATLFRQFVDREARTNLSACYVVFGKRITEFSTVGRLITDLNSFDSERLGEPDFTTRLIAFEEINEKLWKKLSEVEWKPLMFNMLFFMRDPEELALRNNGKFAIMRMIESQNAPHLVAEYILPAIKKGLRDTDDKFRRLYIDLLSQCAHSNVLPSLNVLLYNGDEEADFFININHVQVHRRRRAVQRLGKHAGELEESTIAHYLLSILEGLVVHSGSKNSELNHLADDALNAITALLKHVNTGQFKSVAKRCVQNVVEDTTPANLRKSVRMVTAVAQSTPNGLDDFIVNVLVPPLHRILSDKSNEHENLPDRVPISVAIVYFMRTIDSATLEVHLPGKLTSLCQLLRSKVVELRDNVRQSLGRIAKILGAKYLKFIISEISGALRRGGMQSHVLGYTVHYILAEFTRPHQLQLSVGDIDDSAGMIFRIVMDDTFGSIGSEKDSEDYVTSVKEVKQHKSYDTAEILAAWTSLSQFGKIIEPLRYYLSSTKLTSKTERKIEEVLRRLAVGIHRNPQAATQDAVVLGYQIFRLCEDILSKRQEKIEKIDKADKISSSLAARQAAAKESEEFFTVRLNSRDWNENEGVLTKNSWSNEANSTRYATSNLHLLQNFAIDTLRSVLTSTAGGAAGESGKGLLTIANAKGLIPLVLKGMLSPYEDLNLASLKLASIILRLPVSFNQDDNTLEICAQRTVDFVETGLDTNNPLCQNALKLLTILVRHKPELELKTETVGYVLERLIPDLEEPERQSTAISFIRQIFSRKVMLPQVYDVADTLSKVMVTNHSDHIRTNSRAAYIQFMTTYPLGKTRFNRHLESLGANLRYATPSGRLSVMYTIQMLLQKVGADQLESAFIQYYAALVLIVISDEEPTCRQKASQLIAELFGCAASATLREQMVELCCTWLKSINRNDMLIRGGLEVAIIFFKDKNIAHKFGSSLTTKLKEQLAMTVREILKAGKKSSGSSIEWQLLYLALDTDVTSMIDLVDEVLLFPHPWVRARAARVFGNFFKTTNADEIDPRLLVKVGQKLVRQLGAPRLSSSDGLQIVKNLVFIIPLWQKYQAYIETSSDGERIQCIDWLVQKLSTYIRVDISAAEFIGSKTGAIQILASLPSLISSEKLCDKSYEVILALYVLKDQLTNENTHEELRDLAEEALTMYNEKLGTTEYFKRYTEAKQFVESRRRERKAKRSIEAITDPEVAAKKRMKRNSHKRDARKYRKVKST